MSDMLQLVGETFALLPLNRICLIFLSAISAQQNREDSLPAERAKNNADKLIDALTRLRISSGQWSPWKL